MLKDTSLAKINEEVARVWKTDTRYSASFHDAIRCLPHEMLKHVHLHVIKAAGKIAIFIDEADHKGKHVNAMDIERFVADLVICACRMSQSTSIPFDIQAAVISRLKEIERRQKASGNNV